MAVASFLPDGAGALSFLDAGPDYSPHPTTRAGMFILNPELTARYVVCLLYSLISFLSFYCLFPRFKLYRMRGGTNDFGAFIFSMSNTFLEGMADQESVGERYRRETGAQKAAQTKRDQKKRFKQMMQVDKLTSSSVDGVGFQVVSPLLFSYFPSRSWSCDFVLVISYFSFPYLIS
jgi:hypothetical protein